MNGEPNENHRIFAGFQQINWRPWREFSAIAMILMELSWSVAWFQFMAAPDLALSAAESFLFLSLCIAIAYSLARGMHFLHLEESTRRAVMLTIFLVSVLALMKGLFYAENEMKAGSILVSLNEAFKNAEMILPVEMIVIIFVGYLWNRGVSLAGVWMDARYAVQRFRLGAIMLLALGICTAVWRVEGLAAGIILYLFSSLLAIGAARASTIELLRGGRVPSFDIRWLLGISAASAGVVILAWFLGSFATAAFGNILVAVFYFLLRVLLILGLIIVSPLILFVLLIFSLFENRLQASPLIQEMREQIFLVLERIMEVFDTLGSLLQEFLESLPPLSFIKAVLLWLVVGLFLFWVLRTAGMPRRRSETQDESPDKLESMSPAKGIRTWLRVTLRSRMEALAERLSTLRLGGGLLGAIRVRVIYAGLMRLCEEFGCPRREVQTPLEFLPTLRGLFPSHLVEIELITEAYNRVRYGELPEERMDLQAIEDAWRRIREQAKVLRQVQKTLANDK